MYLFKKILCPKLGVSSILLMMFFLTACSGFFEKDNTPKPTPLISFNPEIKPTRLWMTKTNSGVNDQYLRMGLAMDDATIFTVSPNGTISAIHKKNGEHRWQIYTGLPFTTAPGVGNDFIVIGSRKGAIIALNKNNGQTLWKTNLPGLVLAPPVIDHQQVIIKTTDGAIRSLSSKDGHELWISQQIEPNLILRAASAPLIQNQNIIVGFANGNLVKMNAKSGEVFWIQAIAIPQGAFSIERMIDIDADPILSNHHLFAATYQGKIASLNLSTGDILWSRDISSYTGMCTDQQNIYITDAKGFLWAFNMESGSTEWRQNKLAARVLTGPALMGNYIVVGDGQGYLHWINKKDGHFAAREYVGAMYTTPKVENNILYVLTNNGYLAAYSR